MATDAPVARDSSRAARPGTSQAEDVIRMGMRRRDFLAVSLALAVVPAVDEDDWQGVPRVVAVGDVHGDKDALAAVLKMAGVIDAQERWTGGATHLVQVGDIPSRGPQTRQAFDLVMRLETEAAAAGGRVHCIIGNHDAGVIYGDLRNIIPEEYGEFRQPGSEQRLLKAYEQHLASLKQAGHLPSNAAELDYLKKDWFERHPPGFVEHREAFAPSGPYGSWIRRHNAVIKINDTLFAHAGISPSFANRSQRSINTAIRSELADPDRLLPGMTTNVQSPLWYRGLAEGDEKELRPHVEAVLRFHGVQRIVIGHTVTRTAIMPRHDGHVVDIDIGISRFFGRPPACLVLEKPSPYVLHRGKRIPLPARGQQAEYLRAVEAADEKPSPVSRLLEEMDVKR